MGKLGSMSPQSWRARYGKNLQRFIELARLHDPEGKFSNDYTEKVQCHRFADRWNDCAECNVCSKHAHNHANDIVYGAHTRVYQHCY